jgi:hypothetical protein
MNTQPGQLAAQPTIAMGIFVLNPFGLRLGWQEDLFHLTIGPLMLILVWFSWRSRNAVQENTGESHVNFEH